MIIKYFKKKSSNHKKGIMIAIPAEKEGIVRFGYSLCHTSIDIFDKEFGKKIAIDRALGDRPLNIPDSMLTEFKKFKERCKKYYKQLKIS